MKYYFLFLLLFYNSTAFAQKGNYNLISEYEDTLVIIAERLMFDSTEEMRQLANDAFMMYLDEALIYEKSYSYQFNRLKTISVIASPDKKFRFFTWYLRKDNGTFVYYGRIHKYNKKKKTYEVIKLIDMSNDIRNPEEKLLNEKNWYGGIVYEIIKMKNENYTLLLWDGNNNYSNKKIIDIMYFGGKEKVSFGNKIFDKNYIKNYRVILEYAPNTSVSLKYDQEQNKIIFNHLVPRDKNLEGLKEFYIPDGTFDAFNFKNNFWLLEMDIDARNNDKEIKNKKIDSGLIPK